MHDNVLEYLLAYGSHILHVGSALEIQEHLFLVNLGVLHVLLVDYHFFHAPPGQLQADYPSRWYVERIQVLCCRVFHLHLR